MSETISGTIVTEKYKCVCASVLREREQFCPIVVPFFSHNMKDHSEERNLESAFYLVYNT